jgi:Fe-S-cluster containining protein
MGFPCTKCGLCCRALHLIPALSDYDNGNGVCRYLVDNLCSIYENRPEICDVEKMYLHYFSGTMSKEEFFEKNHQACLELASKMIPVKKETVLC